MCEWFVATNILAEDDKPSNAPPTKSVVVGFFFNEKLMSGNKQRLNNLPRVSFEAKVLNMNDITRSLHTIMGKSQIPR